MLRIRVHRSSCAGHGAERTHRHRPADPGVPTFPIRHLVQPLGMVGLAMPDARRALETGSDLDDWQVYACVDVSDVGGGSGVDPSRVAQRLRRSGPAPTRSGSRCCHRFGVAPVLARGRVSCHGRGAWSGRCQWGCRGCSGSGNGWCRVRTRSDDPAPRARSGRWGRWHRHSDCGLRLLVAATDYEGLGTPGDHPYLAFTLFSG